MATIPGENLVPLGRSASGAAYVLGPTSGPSALTLLETGRRGAGGARGKYCHNAVPTVPENWPKPMPLGGEVCPGAAVQRLASSQATARLRARLPPAQLLRNPHPAVFRYRLPSLGTRVQCCEVVKSKRPINLLNISKLMGL